MKKIEVSIIKRLPRISSQPFISFKLELSSILSLSHTLAHLEYSWNILGALWHTLDLDKEGKGKQEIARE